MNNLDGIKASLYQAALGDGEWAVAAKGLRQLVKSDLLAMSTTDRVTGRDVLIYGDCSQHYTELYHALRADNPFVPAMDWLKEGDSITDSALLDRDVFSRTEFFDAWLRPQRQHSAGLMAMFRRGSLSSNVMFSRGGRIERFGDAEIDALSAMQPTIRHAMELHTRLVRGRLEQTGKVLDGQAIGWLAVETSGKIVWANHTADIMLAGADGPLTARYAMLRSCEPRQTQRLLKALNAAAARDGRSGQGSNLIFRSADSGEALAASVVPADNLFVKGLPEINGAYIALQDLSKRLHSGIGERMGKMFDLTPRETELAMALADGQTLAESAVARGLSLPTVRTQLAQLLRKTGTSRQSQLVALLLSTLPVPFVD